MTRVPGLPWRVQDAADGLAKATLLRDDAFAKLKQLRTINEKLAKLTATFDERAYAAAGAAGAPA